jgi:hypothetical protein
MYSKSEAKALKQEFWTTFGKWSLQKRKSRGKGRWLLNKTGVKGFRFKFETGRKTICVCLEIIDNDAIIREIRYEKLLQLKELFDEAMNNELIWEQEHFITPEKSIVRVFVKKEGLTPNNKNHWPEIFSFFYEKMNTFEEVFLEYKELLDENNY